MKKEIYEILKKSNKPLLAREVLKELKTMIPSCTSNLAAVTKYLRNQMKDVVCHHKIVGIERPFYSLKSGDINSIHDRIKNIQIKLNNSTYIVTALKNTRFEIPFDELEQLFESIKNQDTWLFVEENEFEYVFRLRKLLNFQSSYIHNVFEDIFYRIKDIKHISARAKLTFEDVMIQTLQLIPKTLATIKNLPTITFSDGRPYEHKFNSHEILIISTVVATYPKQERPIMKKLFLDCLKVLSYDENNVATPENYQLFRDVMFHAFDMMAYIENAGKIVFGYRQT